MTNQKDNDSEDFDLGQSSIEAVDSGGISRTDPSEEDNDSELLFLALSQIQTVRVPGQGKLTLNEALATAIIQGDAFSRWCERSTPIGEIEVWVEERRVMSVLPQSPAELQEFTFKVPSPDTAVLQLTTSAGGEKTVLYNLRLREVPPEGLSHLEAWPNGQSMSLNITSRIYVAVGAGASNSSSSGSERLEEFCIRIAINPQTVEAASLTTTEGPSHERATTVSEEHHLASDEKPKAMAARAGVSSSTKLAMLTGLILCSILVGGVGSSFGTPPCETPKQLIGASSNGSSTLEPAEGKVAATPASAGFDLAIPSLPEAKVVDARSGLSAVALKLRSPARSAKTAVKSNTVIAAHHTAPKTERDQTVAFEPPSLSPWQLSVYPKLAALRNVHLKLDGQDAETAKMENLRVSFVRLWEASERFKVLSDTEQAPVDGVISLSFESTEPCLGVVLLKVNGPDGKFLWQDFAWEAPAACRDQQGVGQNNLFSDASIALVNRLKSTIRLAQESSKRPALLAVSD